MELTIVLRVPGVGWTEKEVRQLMKKTIPEQGFYLLDMKPDYEDNYTYILLEWWENIPAGFQKSAVRSMTYRHSGPLLVLLSVRLGKITENLSLRKNPERLVGPSPIVSV